MRIPEVQVPRSIVFPLFTDFTIEELITFSNSNEIFIFKYIYHEIGII